MRSLVQLSIPALVLLASSGCAWLGAGEMQRSLEEGETQRVVIPEGLDSPQFVDAMPIPEISDPRGLVGQDYEVRMPDVLSTSFGVEQIVIKRLAEDTWVFLDVPPAIVWPKVVQFWEARNMTVSAADPSTGVLESEWLAAHDGDAESIFASIAEGTVLSQSSDMTQHRFRLRIEPGIRSGSTEIYLEQKEMRPGAPFRMDNVSWGEGSDNKALEDEVLKAMAFYLGETVNQGTISLEASKLVGQSRAELIPDRERPVLKYKLDFNRAWATVGNALENARVPVEDLDRTSANYYVYYSSEHNPSPGFFSKLFGGGNKQNPENRYTVHLTEADNEVHVTVEKPSSQAESLVAERLLRVIKEYST